MLLRWLISKYWIYNQSILWSDLCVRRFSFVEVSWKWDLGLKTASNRHSSQTNLFKLFVLEMTINHWKPLIEITSTRYRINHYFRRRVSRTQRSMNSNLVSISKHSVSEWVTHDIVTRFDMSFSRCIDYISHCTDLVSHGDSLRDRTTISAVHIRGKNGHPKLLQFTHERKLAID